MDNATQAKQLIDGMSHSELQQVEKHILNKMQLLASGFGTADVYTQLPGDMELNAAQCWKFLQDHEETIAEATGAAGNNAIAENIRQWCEENNIPWSE